MIERDMASTAQLPSARNLEHQAQGVSNPHPVVLAKPTDIQQPAGPAAPAPTPPAPTLPAPTPFMGFTSNGWFGNGLYGNFALVQPQVAIPGPQAQGELVSSSYLSGLCTDY